MNDAQWWERWKRARKRKHRWEYPRAGEPWGVAEDRRLKRIVKKQSKKMRPRGYKMWAIIGAALGRTPLGVHARWQTLMVVEAHMKARRRRG